MILSFTGTRRGMTSAQRRALMAIYERLRPEQFVHGGAVGADEEADELVSGWLWDHTTGEQRLGLAVLGRLPIVVLPGSEERVRYWRESASRSALREVWDADDPLDRNHAIVKLGHQLIATPRGLREELRSGTWMTVRTARKVGKPVTILAPDGSAADS